MIFVLYVNSFAAFSKYNISLNKPLYDDQWDGNIFNYTGMGKSGDQSVQYKQNKTLNESNNNGIRVYLFESYVDGEYIFFGEVKLSGMPFYVDEPGEDGIIRKVLKFPLTRVLEEKIIYDISDIVSDFTNTPSAYKLIVIVSGLFPS